MRQDPLYAIAAALNFMMALVTSAMGGAMQAPPLFLATAWFAAMAILCAALVFICADDETGDGEAPELRGNSENQAPLFAIAVALNFMMALVTSAMGGAMQAPPLFLATAWFVTMTFLFAALAFICAEDEGGKSPAANTGDTRITVRL